MNDSALSTDTKPTGIQLIKSYILSPEVKERFTDMMGSDAMYYLNQVLILVANSDDLQKCSPQSILTSAMRAASLRLSVDPVHGQAWIIPYKNRRTGKDEAQFQLGYKGVYELAMRTNLYRFINVVKVFEGEELIENRMTGNHTIGGHRTGDKVIARMLYFQLFTGFEKTFPMTVKQIEDHAKHYSQAYNSPRSKWNDPMERPKMEDKTVLVNGLRRWGRFNAADKDMLNEIESERTWNSGGELPDENTVTIPAPPTRSYSQTMSELGFPGEPEPTKRTDVNMETGEIIEAEHETVSTKPDTQPELIPTDKPKANVWSPEALAEIAKNYPGEVVNRIKNVLVYAKAIEPGSPMLEVLTWYGFYREARGQDKTPAEASAIADSKLTEDLVGEAA
jgi:recombination protein RecT